MIIRFLCLLTFLISFSLEARLYFQISIENKKGIDLGLVLTSELFSLEEIQIEKPLILKMKNGVGVELRTVWNDEKVQFGPSSDLKIYGRIFNKKNKTLKDFSEDPLLVAIGEEAKLVHEKVDQLIELKIIPEIR